VRGLHQIGTLLAAVAAVFPALGATLPIETDLLALADSGRRGGALQAVSRGLATQGRVLLEGNDTVALRAEAETIARAFDQPPAKPHREIVKFIAGRAAGLLAPETRDLLLAGRFREVSDAAFAKLVGPVPPLFPVKGDPFLLGTDYVLLLQANLAEGWSLDGEFPVCTRGETNFLLLTLDLAHVDAARIAAFLERCAARPADAPVKIWCGGAPFHSARTSERARREIGLLSGISLALVVLFGGMLFRSFRFLPQLLLVQGAGFLCATAALFACFPRPHVLTFVFGTSLIGLSVDYVYHVRAAGGVRVIRRPLTLSLLSTVGCFAPLLFAPVGVLRQMAVFTIAGLVAVYGLVSFIRQPFIRQSRKGVAGRSRANRTTTPLRGGRIWGGRIGLVVLALCGLPRLQLVDDPAAFYRPSVELAAGERRLAEVSPAATTRFAFVPGATLQEALENEERLGVKGLSAVIPSLKRQRENAALVARLVAAEGSNHTARTGIRMPAKAQGAFLDPERLPECPLKRMVDSMYLGGGLLSPLSGAAPPGVEVLEPRAALREVFGRLTAATVNLLVASLVVFLVFLAIVFRRAFLCMAWPFVLTFASTAGVLGWLGVPVTFFTLLCFFVLAGLGVDYVVFHRGDPAPETRRTVFYSFLTSFAGLGMLAFTDFAVTRAMGVTFAVGLFFAYVFSCGGSSRAAPDGPWFRQTEQSAGTLRLRFMWWVYVHLGKTALKILCIPVMAFIFPFAASARRALRAFYSVLGVRASDIRIFRHLLGFAWSLVDKTDACTLKRDLPRMTVRDDAGSHAFRALVAAGRGAFLVSTHVGTVEVLPALAAGGGRVPHMHAFQQMGHDAVFTRMFMRHFDASRVTLHAVEAIGVETACAMQEAIARGDLVLMAGDRVSAGSGRTLAHDFLGRPCRWPKGVFAFARLMECPVFFVSCVRTGWNAYACRFAAFDGEPARMLDGYVAFLEEETRRHPEQWHQFYDFFARAEDGSEADNKERTRR